MQELKRLLEDARSGGDYQAIVDFVPYARLIGMEIDSVDGDQLRFRLPFRQQNIGNFKLPALHGGVIGAFMEHSALVQLLWSGQSEFLPKVIDFSIDYLRPGRPETTYAECDVLRQGQRVANVAIRTWQSDPDKAIAVARTHFLLSRPEEVA